MSFFIKLFPQFSCPILFTLPFLQYRKDEGTVYEGQWSRGVRQGKGTITYKDGSFYRGDFSKDQMWGRGVFVGSDGTQYDGEVFPPYSFIINNNNN